MGAMVEGFFFGEDKSNAFLSSVESTRENEKRWEKFCAVFHCEDHSGVVPLCNV
jgi:hypothetical protein